MKYIIGIKIPQELAYKITLATRTLSKHFTPLDLPYIVLKQLEIDDDVSQIIEALMTNLVLEPIASSIKPFTVNLQCIDVINSHLALCADAKGNILFDLNRQIDWSLDSYTDPERKGFDLGLEVAELSASTSVSGYRVKRASVKLRDNLPKERNFEVKELYLFILNQVTGKFDKEIPLPLGK